MGEDDSMDFAKKEVCCHTFPQHAAEVCARRHVQQSSLSPNVAQQLAPLAALHGVARAHVVPMSYRALCAKLVPAAIQWLSHSVSQQANAAALFHEQGTGGPVTKSCALMLTGGARLREENH